MERPTPPRGRSGAVWSLAGWPGLVVLRHPQRRRRMLNLACSAVDRSPHVPFTPLPHTDVDV